MSGRVPTFSLAALQPLGRSLMLPIAVLPVAGLLLRLGQPDLLNIAFVAAAGDAIFHNLGLLFAIGVSVGFAKDGNGAAALAGAVCFLVAGNGAQALMTVPPDAVAGLTGKAKDLAERRLQDRGDQQAQRAARHPLGRDRRRLLQPLRRRSSCRNTWPSSAAGVSCRSSAAWRGSSWPACSARAGPASAPGSTSSATPSSRRGRSVCSPTAF